MSLFSLVITAAGSSSRFDGRNKCLVEFDGKLVIQHVLDTFLQFDWVDVIVTASDENLAIYQSLMKRYSVPIKVILGGDTRFESVREAVNVCRGETVMVHDAARPFISTDLIRRVRELDLTHKAAVPGVMVVDTIKRVDSDGCVVETPARDSLRAIQTPQRFDVLQLKACYERSYHEEITDEAMLLELNQVPVKVIEGDIANRKITYPSDLD